MTYLPLRPKLIRNGAAFTWLLLILCCLGYSGSKAIRGGGFESNILSLMPDTLSGVKNSEVANQMQQQGERNLAILVSDSRGEDGLQMAGMLHEKLSRLSDLQLVYSGKSLEDSLRTYYHPFRYQVLSAATRDLLKSKTGREIAELRLANLSRPFPNYSLYSFVDDPFNLSASWVRSLFFNPNISTEAIPSVREGDITWYILVAVTGVSGFNLDLQRSVTDALDQFSYQNPHANILRSGLLFHASKGSTIARSEISVVGIGSFLSILFLMFFVFRSLRKMLYIFMVLACSMLVALSVTWLIFDRVHLVTLAFGSTLLGLAADYCFHFLMKLHTLGSPQLARQAILKGLLVSVLSSIAAYLFQLASPLPGLQQFAVFVASGLAAACFTVLISADYFDVYQSKPTALGAVYEHRLKFCYKRVVAHKTVCLLALSSFIILSTATIFHRGVNDDIRLLNTSGESLLDSENKVRSLLGGLDRQRYFVVKGDSQEELLQRSERLIGKISVGSNQVVSPSLFMPSLSQQKSDYALVRDKVFSSDGAASFLCQQLNDDCSWLEPMPEFRSDLASGEFPAVLRSSFPTLGLLDYKIAVVFFRNFAELDMQSIHLPGVEYVDQVTHLSALLKDFRQQVSGVLVAFILLLVAISYWLFGGKAQIIAGSVIISSLVALLLSGQSGITLFHVLALLLVVGIAVDTAVFFINPGLDQSTWAASTLACLTSIIGFGLLALSQIPILHQFGQVVFYGLVTAWIVTPLLWHFHDDVDCG